MTGNDRLDPFVSVLAARARARVTEHDLAEVPLSESELASARDRILAALDEPARSASRSGGRKVARWTTLGVASLAAAAALTLHLEFAPASSLRAGASEYTVSVAGHVEVERAATSAPSSTLQARAGAIQEVVLRPREAIAVPVEATVLVVREGRPQPSGVRAEVTDRGVVRFTVDGDALVGASEVRASLARAHALSLGSRLSDGEADEGRIATVTILVEN